MDTPAAINLLTTSCFHRTRPRTRRTPPVPVLSVLTSPPGLKCSVRDKMIRLSNGQQYDDWSWLLIYDSKFKPQATIGYTEGKPKAYTWNYSSSCYATCIPIFKYLAWSLFLTFANQGLSLHWKIDWAEDFLFETDRQIFNLLFWQQFQNYLKISKADGICLNVFH
jgi:hypothetical protein